MAVAPNTALRTESELVAYSGLVVSTFCWASAFIAGKLALAEMSPLTVAVWRYALAGLLLLPFAWRQRSAVDFGTTAAPLAIMVLCGGLIYPWVFLLALQRTSATNTSLLIALNPVFTVLLAPLIGEALTRRRVAGVVVALLGAALVITRGDLEVMRTLAMNSGDLLAVLAAATWATFNLASRRTMTQVTPAVANAVIYLCGCFALGVISLPDAPLGQLLHASSAALWSIVAMAVLSSVVAGQLFLVGVRTLGVSRTVVFVYVVPVLTAGLSALFLGDTFGTPQAIGGTAVLAGVYLSTQRGG
jgi:drug/metabolite transporter (DMT)-like permease